MATVANRGDDGWQVNYGNEFFMVNRAFKAIRRADVVLLMVDVEAGITEQVRCPLSHPPTSGKFWPLRIELPLVIFFFT